ncbi:MAG TPA: protein kinase [Longimicrobiaceae bacterium]|nr:protein kinase [Longimicrobiaceae bacterium]
MVGKTVGKYRIVDRLGRGGMGTVYKAVDETLDRDVAIKVLNPDLGDVEVLKRFRAEAVALARLNHPGIATIYELYRQDDDLLMVMEFVRGETLQALSERLGMLAPPQAVHICLQILDALGHAHRAGVVHRDLKPANVMVTEAGVAKVMDFGIARVLGTEHFTHGSYMMGTPAYMAPEQVLGAEVDGRADIYSAGVVLYRLLSRELPFKADTAIAMVQKQVGDLPTPIRTFRPDLPEWCGQVIDRALAKRPEDRFQSAEEFRKALLAAVHPEALGEMPTMLTPTPMGLPIDPELTRTYGTGYRYAAGAAAAAPGDETILATSGIARDTAAQTAGGTDRQARSDRTTTTVVMGRTHLLTLGALLLILGVGVAVLAFAALRRGDAPQAQLSAPLSEPAVEQAQTTGSEGSDAADPAQLPPAEEPVVADRGATERPRVPAEPPAPVVTAAAGVAEPATKARPPAASAAMGNGAPAPAPDLRKAAPDRPPAKSAVEEAEPEAAAPTMVRGVRVLVADGDTLREREAVLLLEGRELSLREGPEGPAIVSLAYSGIAGAVYSRGNHPRWRGADGAETEARVDRGRLGFLRGERNWLVLTTASEPIILRIEDAVMRTALSDFQERSGVTIQR